MNEEIHPVKIKKSGPVNSRPVILTLICLFCYVFFSLLALFFLAGIIWTDWVITVTNQYAPSELFSATRIRFYFIAGFLLHLLALTGSILIWRLKKTGYFLLGLSCLAIASIQSLVPQITITTTAAYILLLVLLGIFYRRLH